MIDIHWSADEGSIQRNGLELDVHWALYSKDNSIVLVWIVTMRGENTHKFYVTKSRRYANTDNPTMYGPFESIPAAKVVSDLIL
jgi:hypothetical protein